MQRLDLVPADERDEGGAILDMTIVSYDQGFDMTLLRSAAGDIHVQGWAGEIGKTHPCTDQSPRCDDRNRGATTHQRTEYPAGQCVSPSTSAGGASVNVALDCAGTPLIARITRQSVAALNLQPGLPVFAVVKAVSIA